MLSGAQEHAQGDIVGARNQTTNVNNQWAAAAKAAQENATATNAAYGKGRNDFLAKQEAPGGGGSAPTPVPDSFPSTTAFVSSTPPKDRSGDLLYQMEPQNWFDPTSPLFGSEKPAIDGIVRAGAEPITALNQMSMEELKRKKLNAPSLSMGSVGFR
jgi:hypothetical protein